MTKIQKGIESWEMSLVMEEESQDLHDIKRDRILKTYLFPKCVTFDYRATSIFTTELSLN